MAKHLATRLAPYFRNLATQQSESVSRFGADLEIWPEQDLFRVLCGALDIPWLQPSIDQVDEEFYRTHSDWSHRLRFIPLWTADTILVAGMDEPWHGARIRELRNLTGMEVRTVGIPSRTFDTLLAGLAEAKRHALTNQAAPISAPVRPSMVCSWQVFRRDMDQTVRGILLEAIEQRVADVFFEEEMGKMRIRFKGRDGCMVMPPVSGEFVKDMVNSLKVLAGISPTVNEGLISKRASIPLRNRTFNFRVEFSGTQLDRIQPGATFAFRLLDDQALRSLGSSLPFEGRDLALMRHVITQQQGLIYVTGPTGSGKTTTLYRMLLSYDAATKKIVTVEDPVEYVVPQFTQLQVKPEAPLNLTFANAVRSFMRQAPDVILVGETRDADSAGAAVQASLTGHLVYSTLHTLDTIGAIPRLIDPRGPNVAPELLSSSLLAVLAQRLVPTLCHECKQRVEIDGEIASHYRYHGLEVPDEVFAPGGCPACGGTGTVSRKAIFEIFYPTEDLRQLIRSERFNEPDLRRVWREQGGISLGVTALTHAASGQIAYARAKELDFLYDPRARDRNLS